MHSRSPRELRSIVEITILFSHSRNNQRAIAGRASQYSNPRYDASRARRVGKGEAASYRQVEAIAVAYAKSVH